MRRFSIAHSTSSSSQRTIIVLCAVCSAIAFGLLTQTIFPAVAIIGVSGLFFFANNPKLILSLVGFCYPLMFIIKEPFYSFFFASLYAAVYMCGLVLFLLLLQRRIFLNLGHYIPILIAILLGVITSTVNGDSNPVLYRTTFAEYFMYITLFLGASLFISQENQIDYFIKPFLFSLTILSILLLIQFFFEYEIVYNWSKGLLSKSRLYFGEGANLNMLANLYLYALPVLFFKILLAGRKGKRFYPIYLTLFFVNFIPFLLFQSRSSYIGLAIGLCLAILFFRPIRISGKRIMVGVVVLTLLFIITYNMQQFLMIDRLSSDTANEDAGLRLEQVKAVLRLLFDYPLGIGRERYYALIGTYGGITMSPHNLVLDGTLKIGLIGISGYLAIVSYTFFRLLEIRSYTVKTKIKGLVSAIFAAFTAYLIHNTVHNPGFQFETWVFLGLAAALTSPAMIHKYKAG